MIRNKLTRQYNNYIVTAISKARKSETGKISHVKVVNNLAPDQAFTFMQWACSEGWLHSNGHEVYEARKTTGMPICEILHELNNRNED